MEIFTKGYHQCGYAVWALNRCKIPVAEYCERSREFNPVNYDLDAWPKMVKDVGMKYLIITAKHRDGFALFDSKASDWNVVDATRIRGAACNSDHCMFYKKGVPCFLYTQ